MNELDFKSPSPFHKHEQVIQARVGKREVMENFARKVVRSYLPEQHREFYNQLPYIVAGSVDDLGDPWATILAGTPGFISSPSPTSLAIKLNLAPGDSLAESLKHVGASIGLLGINLENRRRNRVNVRVVNVDNEVLNLSVDQSFGNCPQYIQTRKFNYVSSANTRSNKQTTEEFSHLDKSATNLISSSDTFFVSSFIVEQENPTNEGVDVSHRGGKPGFVKVEGNTLTIPDYLGNYHFNTLGNFLANPKAGLVFPDFETGDLLCLTGSTEILWEDHPEVKFFRGAQRAWRFVVKKGKWLRRALPFTATFDQYSVNSEMTGTWQEAKERAAAEQLRTDWQPMKLVKVEKESSVISSFYLKHANGKSLLPFEAGQYITLQVMSNSHDKPKIRTYTLSSAPHEEHYRISIKREQYGSVSKFMHDQLRVGDIINVRYPSGNFYIDTTVKRPAVLIAGGVGITPMISMARHVLNEGVRTRHLRDLHVFHSVKNTEQRAFGEEFKTIEQQSGNSIRYYSFLTAPTQHDRPGKDYNGSGRITADILRQVLQLDDYDFYICGPSEFMQAIYDQLLSLGINDHRIYAEAFGPASLTRKPTEEEVDGKDIANNEADETVIKFANSGFEQRWNKGEDVLLEVAESHGLTPSFSCRNGICGACAVKVLSGEVCYRTQPSTTIPDGHALICCSVPAKGTEKLEIEL